MKTYTAKTLHPDASDLNDKAYKSACRFFKGGRYGKAISGFEEALSYWPKDAQAWMALGNCYDELKKPAGAEKCFKRALMYCKDKDRDGILFNLGNSLLDQGRYPAAIEVYDRISQKSAVIGKVLKNRLIAEEYLSSRKKRRS